jgi:hypothetical protein
VATVDAGADAGTTWCYPCLTGSDCPAGLGCGADTSFHCGPCQQDPDCAPGSFCDGNGVCQSGCDSGACPPDQVCGNGACWECLSPLDCPATEGCNDVNRSCGSCTGSLDCAPGEVCAIPLSGVGWGACLQNCDARSCPASRPFCAVLPDLTPDHSYCFGCLQDSDCADAGPGAWCDLSLLDLYGGGTFSCLLPPP